MAKRVYTFNEGNRDDRQLLGGKGANLCEMTALGLPVPFGFIITTRTCREFFEAGNHLPSSLETEYLVGLEIVERQMGAKFGDPENPLLFSVRSGAPVSMPGMMNTVLNLGMNDDIARGLAEKTGNSRFAYDSYRRFIQMFADVVLGVETAKFERVLDSYKADKKLVLDTDLTDNDWQVIIGAYKNLVDFPEDPHTQLRMAIEAVFKSWHTPRAKVYREMNNIPEATGTAVTVQAMVFGNFGDDSGSGVAFTRNPSTGKREFFGEFLFNSAGEDVVAGIRTPESLEALKLKMPDVYQQLYRTQELLETHYRDMQDIEFTIQEGKLYLLQTRNGKRTGRASVRIAVEMVNEGMLSEAEALMRVSPDHVESFLHPMIDPNAERNTIASGLPASPGGATGRVVFSADDAVTLAADGTSVILVRRETTPEDIHGMRVAAGILTELGGMTSHAAVVARGMGVCAITGCSNLSVNVDAKVVQTTDGVELREGDIITLDGTSGEVMLGDLPKVEASGSDDFQILLNWADKYRRLKVRANAETKADAMKARELGAEGIGLCRTEHMFFEPERIDIMRAMILSETDVERLGYLQELEEFQYQDMSDIFRIMDGMPVNIRLLDPPLHEFLPHGAAEIAVLAERTGKSAERITEITRDLAEVNPMLGFRGCRLSVIFPEITEMQARAIIRAAADAITSGVRALPEIMIPLVINVREIRHVTELVERSILNVMANQQVSVPYKIGTMMETPRACLSAHRLAPEVEFMSFGTNDLTQMTYGLSRDDAARFIPEYLEKQLVSTDPFVSLDTRGVGELMNIAIRESRRRKPGIRYSICGEHGGDPESIQFCHDIGLDYVSCSPYRLPVARVAAAQASVARSLAS